MGKKSLWRGVKSKSESFKSLPASLQKPEALKKKAYDSLEEDRESKTEKLQRFRLVDICVLATVFEPLLCPSCKRAVLSLEEVKESKMGLASLLSALEVNVYFLINFTLLIK